MWEGVTKNRNEGEIVLKKKKSVKEMHRTALRLKKDLTLAENSSFFFFSLTSSYRELGPEREKKKIKKKLCDNTVEEDGMEKLISLLCSAVFLIGSSAEAIEPFVPSY